MVQCDQIWHQINKYQGKKRLFKPFEQFCTILYITYDNLTLSEVIEGLFLPHAQNDCKIAVSSSSQSLIEFIYFILAICDSPCWYAIIFLMKSFSVFYNIYIYICLQIYILLGLCRLVGIGYRIRGIFGYTKRSRRLDCANRYIVRDIVVLSHALVSGWCVILSMDMGLFSIQCVPIVELINFLCKISLFS